mgnify:CR=1 FL=1
MNYHATLEDAKRFIIWFATSDTDVSDWDEKRYLDAVAMVRAIDSLHSRAPHEDLTAVLNENAIAQRYVSDANEEVNRLRAENAALRELVERLPKTKDGVPVIADDMTLYCPRGHEHKLTPADTRVYCLQGECWHKGCQGDSGSGTFWQYEQCTAILNGGAK